MEKLLISSVAAMALSCSLFSASVVATVNDKTITSDDVAAFLKANQAPVDFSSLTGEVKEKIINQLIEKYLLTSEAIKDGIQNSDEFKNELEKAKNEISLEVWMKKQFDKVSVSDEDAKKFYDSNGDKFKQPEMFNAKHIIVKTEAEAKDIISQLDKAPNKVEKFKELSKKSLDTASAKNGGALGRFAVEQMVPEFGSAVKALAKGTYSKTPVKTQFGYHVIYLKDKFSSKTFAYTEVEKNINQVLIGNALNKKIKELVEDLRKDAKIVIK